jgi:hypothetical protein
MDSQSDTAQILDWSQCKGSSVLGLSPADANVSRAESPYRCDPFHACSLQRKPCTPLESMSTSANRKWQCSTTRAKSSSYQLLPPHPYSMLWGLSSFYIINALEWEIYQETAERVAESILREFTDR